MANHSETPAKSATSDFDRFTKLHAAACCRPTSGNQGATQLCIGVAPACNLRHCQHKLIRVIQRIFLCGTIVEPIDLDRYVAEQAGLSRLQKF
jgi:hypothetical protein